MTKADTTETEAPAAGQPEAPAPRKRGRPKGLPKTGGRVAGQKPLTAPEIRDALLGRSNAIEELCKIAKGEQMRWSGPTGKVVWRYPTASEQIAALRLIIDKTVPTLQATQLSGDPESPLFDAHEIDSMDLARAVMGVLGSAVPAGLTARPEGEGQAEASATTAPKFPEYNPQPEPDPAPGLMNGSPNGHGVAPPAPAPAPAPKVGPARLAEVGEAELVGDRGFFIQLRERREGREKWAVHDATGAMHRATWCTRDEAVKLCAEIEAAGAGNLYSAPRPDSQERKP